MRRADEISHKTYRESLQNNQDIIRQSLELATINTSVPINLDLEALKRGEIDRPSAYELFRELEFRALTNEFAGAAAAQAAVATASSGGGLFDNLGTTSAPVSVDYAVIKDRAGLDKLIRRLFEIEGWSYIVNDANDRASCYNKPAPLGLGIGLGNGEGFYIDLENFDGGIDAAKRPQEADRQHDAGDHERRHA